MEIYWGDIATWTTMIAAIAALIVSSRASIQHKRIEVLIHFYHRYDTLASEKDRIMSKIESQFQNNVANMSVEAFSLDIKNDLKFFAKRFWSLQFDQFDMWRRGYVDLDTYEYWISGKRRAAEKARLTKSFEIDCYLHTKGWNDICLRWEKPAHKASTNEKADFKKFMTDLLTNSKVGIDQLLVAHGPSLWRRIGLL